ncbi:MAG: AMP-binding protein, partial [Thermoleophilaceae bacterium]|nr:AMP-binding protein [Thermoleophilaceae bacterium]
APREEVWELIGDPAGWPGFMPGITRFDPEDGPGPDLCVGSRFSMRMHVGSADVGGLIEFVECDPRADLAWTSITGIDQRGRWRLRETSGGDTRVILRLSYGAPGGLLGLLTDRLAAGEVRHNLRASLENLKARVEGEAMSKEQGPGIAGKVMHEVGSLRVLAEARIIRPIRPDKLVRLASTIARWGRSPAAGFIAGAVTSPHEPAVVDELGTLTFAEVDRRSNALAHSLSDAGLKEGDGVAIMCRNHRGFVESTVAVAKLGAHALYLNTAFAGPQLTEVVQREKPVAIIYDEEFADLLADAGKRRKRFIAWREDSSDDPADPTLEGLIADGPIERPVPPQETGKAIILTSGTTGTPKGANRSSPQSLDPAISLLSKIPLRTRQTTYIAAPLFHSWGFAHFTIGLLLSSTMVLARKFDPESCLAQIERTRAESLVVVPVMMQRILDLPEATRRRYDVSSLRVVAASGSALPGDLATEWMDGFGDNLYNLYGSTEVAWATIATPGDMRAAPGTAGKPPRGTVLKLYDEKGREVPPGETGRIFVGNEMLFEGYTGGGSKDEIDGLMATGDVGRLDDAGRLFVEGRDDEMIVSGGENLFPKEVEDLMARHDDVAEVAAIGVDDEKFGQRLRAFVVPCGGKSPSEDALKSYVKSNLAGYKVPREIWFLDELPRNATGKVLKRELKEMEEAPK